MAKVVAVPALVPSAAVVDACLRVGAPALVAPAGLRPVAPEMHLTGEIFAVRHYGSVDVFLEAFEEATPGQILVIDNAGRNDEACIGDLTALEAQAARMAGIIVWGLHRDTAELQRIGLPVFSLGRIPAGPAAARSRPPDAFGKARVGAFEVSTGDHVAADADGAAFVRQEDAKRVFDVALEITAKERGQSQAIRSGTSLRAQLRFREFLAARKRDPKLTFRDHLRKLGGEIEQ